MKHFIILLALILLLPLSVLASNMIGTPNVDTVNIRKEPSTQSNKLGEAKRGQQIGIIGEVVNKNGDKWYQIEMGNGRTGYVSAQFIDIKSGQMPPSQNQAISSAGFPAATAVPRITPFPDVTPFRTAAPSPTPTTSSASTSNREKSYTKVELRATNVFINVPEGYIEEESDGDGTRVVTKGYTCENPYKFLQVFASSCEGTGVKLNLDLNQYTDPSIAYSLIRPFEIFYGYMDSLYGEVVEFIEFSYSNGNETSCLRFVRPLPEIPAYYYFFYKKTETNLIFALLITGNVNCDEEFLDIIAPITDLNTATYNAENYSKETIIAEKEFFTKFIEILESKINN